MKSIRLFLICILFFSPFFVSAKVEQFVDGSQFSGLNCETYTSLKLKRAVKYCVHRTRPDLVPLKGEPVIYFFHGINGGAASWVDNGYAEAMEILSKEENFPSFTWVSFDTEAMSFFSDFQSRTNGTQAYETWFISEFIPFIENRFSLCDQRACRMTAGVSMGGFGALKTAMRHPDLFSASAANSPALAPFNAYESFDRWNQFFSRHPVGPVRGQLLLAQVKRVFPSFEVFDQNEVAILTEKLKNQSQFPKLYFDVGGKDYFGFQEGYFRFRDALLQNEISHTAEYFPDGSHELFWERRWWLIRWVRDQVLTIENQ